MNKVGRCVQWRNELFKTQNDVFLRKQGRNERSGDIGNCTMMPVALLRPVRIHHIFPIPTARWIFLATLGIRILLADSCARWRRFFKRFSQDGWRPKFAENLRAAPCNKELSNETFFSLVNIAGQYTVFHPFSYNPRLFSYYKRWYVQVYKSIYIKWREPCE